MTRPWADEDRTPTWDEIVVDVSEFLSHPRATTGADLFAYSPAPGSSVSMSFCFGKYETKFAVGYKISGKNTGVEEFDKGVIVVGTGDEAPFDLPRFVLDEIRRRFDGFVRRDVDAEGDLNKLWNKELMISMRFSGYVIDKPQQPKTGFREMISVRRNPSCCHECERGRSCCGTRRNPPKEEPMISIEAFEKLHVTWTQRTYGRTNKTTYYFANVEVPGLGSVQIGDPWPGRRPNRITLKSAMRAEWERRFNGRTTRGAARENPSQEDKSEVDAESARSMLQNSRIGDVVTYRSAKTGKICRATVCHKYALYGGIRLQVARTVDENKTMRGEAIVDASNIVSTAGLPRRNPSSGAGGARAPGGMSHSLTPGDKRMIEQIVGNFHVGESDEVIEADMRRRLAKGETPKQLVALAVKHAIKTHHKNRDLYRDVMSGRIGRGR